MSRSILLIPAPTQEWQKRHNDAVTMPHGFESPIVSMFGALETYRRLHATRYGEGIGADGIMGPAWLTIARELRNLLNGDTGRLDCGIIDAAILGLAAGAGFETSELTSADMV